MKNNWLNKEIERSLVFIITIIFSYLFYLSNQYAFSFLSLCLLLIILRVRDLKNLTVSSTSIVAEFSKVEQKFLQIIKSDRSTKEKIEKSQKLIDEIFKLGYRAGGGKSFTNIFDVHIDRDEKGNVKRFEYSEN